MSSAILSTFDAKAQRNEPVFVSFITAGFPTISDTVPTMLALQEGGADIIELGIPFSDPQADGPAIQASNTVALAQNVDVRMCLSFVQQARQQGLTVPVLLMGYYNPALAYGEELIVQDAKKAGANGFIMVDLPPEEADEFRGYCTQHG